MGAVLFSVVLGVRCAVLHGQALTVTRSSSDEVEID